MHRHATTIRKCVALILIVGGIMGALTAIWTVWNAISIGGFRAAGLVILISLFTTTFASCTWVGVELWSGKTRALKLAKLILILQIPSISFSRFAYYFYTAAAVFLSFTHGIGLKTEFDLELGSAIRLSLSSDVEHTAIGINLVAVLLLFVLIKASRMTPPDEGNLR